MKFRGFAGPTGRQSTLRTPKSSAMMRRVKVADGVRSGLPMVRPETASEVEALKARLLVAEAARRGRAHGAARPDRKPASSRFSIGSASFAACMREGQDSPSQGPAAIRHTVLHSGSAARASGRPADARAAPEAAFLARARRGA